MSFELTLMHEVQSLFLDVSWARALVAFCARWLIFVLPLCGLIAWRYKQVRRHALVEMIWSVLLVALIAFAGEWIIARPRPFITDPSLAVLVPPPQTMSFPSAHASIAYALAFVLFGWNRPLGIVALLIADLVVMGRVASGVHYPTDVLAGLVVGLLAFTAVRLGHRWVRKA